jgi:hypothetical protein
VRSRFNEGHTHALACRADGRAHTGGRRAIYDDIRGYRLGAGGGENAERGKKEEQAMEHIVFGKG